MTNYRPTDILKKVIDYYQHDLCRNDYTLHKYGQSELCNISEIQQMWLNALTEGLHLTSE